MARKTTTGLGKLGLLARDIKLAHSVFALPFAFLGVFIAAGGWPGEPSAVAGSADWPDTALNGSIRLLLIFLSMFLARSYAMLMNRYLDRDIDKANPRTAGRAIPSGIVLAEEVKRAAIVNAVGLIVVAGMFAVLDDNWSPLAASPVVLAWLGIYPLAKRHTDWCHYVLGGALALSVPAAALAIEPSVLLNRNGAAIWLLAGFVMLWVAGFDIIYGLADIEFDREHGVHSLPARFGKGDALYISGATHLGAGVLLALSWLFGPAEFHVLYGLGVIGTVGMLVYEQRAAARGEFETAFFTVNGVIALLLGALGILDMLV